MTNKRQQITNNLNKIIMKKIILLFAGLAFLTFQNQAQTTVTDYDGNVYDTVHIGTQVWLKENLKVTHYRNGDSIPNVTDDVQWVNLTTGAAYCNYDNDVNAAITYGRLYNFYAVSDNRSICPTSWHVPTDIEWTTLITYLGGENVAGGKLKETGTTHWQSPNTGATNETGFTALPGGSRHSGDGSFLTIGYYGRWWSSTEYITTNAWTRDMAYNYSTVARTNYYKLSGFSVRCVMDSVTTQINEINYQNEIKIYPNPAIDRVSIDCAQRQDLKMQIYNVVGVRVLQRELNNGTNDIDVSSLSKGIYIIKLTGTDWTVQRKLTKE